MGALSIMGAYNRYDEFYCCSNKKLLTDILRKEWEFDGFVMSDFVWGCRDTEQCLRAGLDVEMMFTMQYGAGKIKKCLKKGSIDEEHIDRAVRNILGVLIRQTPKEEAALIRQMKEQGKKVVVVLYSGCAIIVEEWGKYADAILMNYYSGCEGGTALANLLCGDKNFTGKLPFTVAKTEEDYPSIIGIGEKPYAIEYGYYHGYTKLDKENKEPAYPFGYGLSYTSFAMSGAMAYASENKLTVTVNVKNTGDKEGAEVVQVYVGSKGVANGDDRPVKLLKGFQRIELAPGKERNVVIVIPKDELRFWTPGGWVLDEGYSIYVGNESKNVQEVLT